MSKARQPPGPLAQVAAWLLCISLFAGSVPWYFAAGREPELWLGLPDWVVLSLAACVGVAVTTAWMIHRFWPQDADDESSQNQG